MTCWREKKRWEKGLEVITLQKGCMLLKYLPEFTKTFKKKKKEESTLESILKKNMHGRFDEKNGDV